MPQAVKTWGLCPPSGPGSHAAPDPFLAVGEHKASPRAGIGPAPAPSAAASAMARLTWGPFWTTRTREIHTRRRKRAPNWEPGLARG